jgi:hypothetical protein
MKVKTLRMAKLLATLILLAAATAWPVQGSPGDPPAQAAAAETPIPIFLNAPTDLDAFWKMLSRPDFVILDGDLYRKLRQAAEQTGPPKATPAAVVESIALSGVVSGDWAKLSVDYRVSMASDGPYWVPIQLDGLTISDIRDASGDLPTRLGEGRGWFVELKGSGDHLVRVGLLAPVRSTVEGKKLELAMHPAASTRLDLLVPRTALDASSGANEPIGLTPVPGGDSVRLTARLSPRSRLDLTWRERVDPAVDLPTLLSAQGEISLEIERGSIRSRSSWVVTSIRGATSQLTFRLDSAEELLDIELDGKPVQVETRRERDRSVVTIPLAEPLRSNTTRALLLNTRRPIASTGSALLTLQGYSFDQARVQTGVIAVSRTGPLFVSSTPGRGLRRIDPRTELPERLRARPDTTQAFGFSDQPFELGLSVEPSPPRLRVDSKTTITVDARSARLQASLDCRTSQGRVFEIRVVLPRGLEFEGAEPAEVVESAQVVPLDPGAAASPGVDSPRVLTLTLTPQARESEESEAFTIVLKGWCGLDPSRPVALPLFRPEVDTSEGARIAIVADRNVSVELSPAGEETSAFRVDWGSPPADWPWPARKPGPELGLLRLRSDSNPESLPLKVTVNPRSIRHESTLYASIDRRGAEVVDELAGEVAFGVISRLDVALPAEVPARWEVEGVDLAGRDPLGQDANGARRYRLRFARDYADAFRLRIRYRLPFAEPPEGDREAKLRLAPIRVLEGTSTGRRVSLSADPGLDLKTDATGWNISNLPDASPPSDGGPAVRLTLASAEERPGPVSVVVRSGIRQALPGVVVSRLWIRTVQRPENDLAASARFWVEAHEGPMRVALPTGSLWVRARVGSVALPEGGVEPLAADEYRLRFPSSTPTGPILVAIDYVIPAASTSNGWPTLRLLDGGVVQQSMWEAQVLGSRAGIGVPSGWIDENEWSWSGWIWKRRPWKSPLEVSNWLTGGISRYRLNDPLESGESAGLQSYLFSRVGPPTSMRFAVYSRITLLLLCSGPVLAVGLFVLARRPPPRMMGSLALILAFAAGSLAEPSVLILILQSSLLGFALCLTALAMNWLINRHGHPRAALERDLIVASSSTGSSMVGPPAALSDDSTAIRPRPAVPSEVSTADHVFMIRAPGRHSDEYPTSDPDQP